MTTVAASIERDLLRQHVLNMIPGAKLGYIILRAGIKKDVIMGFIGERGGGKSASAATCALIDFMMNGITVFSNMDIHCDIEIDDNIAREFGLKRGGVAHYKSLPIDMPALLRFDLKYANSCIVLDEINVEVSEARRAMSNTNLFSNRLAQELRHLQSSLLYSCISEMAIDSRLREISDAFIRCEETAFLPENLAVNKPLGIDFQWVPYLMNKCFKGTSYYQTHKAESKYIFHFKPWRGIYDDKQFQGQNMLHYGVDVYRGAGEKSQIPDISMTQSPIVSKHQYQWGWFEKIFLAYKKSGVEEVLAEEIWNIPEVISRQTYKNEITKELQHTYGVMAVRRGGKMYYVFNVKDESNTSEKSFNTEETIQI